MKKKQTKWSVFFILILLTIFSCSKNNEPEEQFNLSSSLEFSIINSQNEDLLNPNNPNHINVANIKLFYVIDGKSQEIYDSNMDNPRNFRIYEHKNEYRIRITTNATETAEKPITYIQWNENDTDTLEVLYERTQNAILQNKIWLNGEQIWERGNNTTDPYFILTK